MYLSILSRLTLLSFCVIMLVSCNKGLISNSDIGMTLAEFTSKVESYSVIEMGSDYAIYSIGEGKTKRRIHFKNDRLVKVER